MRETRRISARRIGERVGWYGRSPMPASALVPNSLARAALITLLVTFVAVGLAVVAAANLGGAQAAVVVPGIAAGVIGVAFALWPAYGLGAFLMVSLLALSIEAALGLDLRYFDELGLLLLLVVAAVSHGIPSGRLRVGAAEGALVVVAGAGIISSLVAAVPLDVWVVGLLLLFKGVAFFYIVSWLRLTVTDVMHVGAILAGVAVLVLAVGFLELIGRNGVRDALNLPARDEVRGGMTVITSIFTHPSLFGWFTAFGSLLLYARFIVARTWWVLPMAILLNIGTLLSGRRTPILGVLLALGIGLLWQWARSVEPRAVVRTWIPLGIGGFIIVVAFLPSWSGLVRETIRDYTDSSAAIAEILDEDPDPEIVSSVAQRTALYVGAVAIARDHFPLGGGLGRFGSYMSSANYSPLYEEYGLTQIYGLSPASRRALTDTFWPSVLGETGVLGLLGFGTFVAVVFRRVWQTSDLSNSIPWRVLCLAGVLVFVDRFVGSMTAMTYVASPIAYFTFGTVGAVLAVAATTREGIVSTND